MSESEQQLQEQNWMLREKYAEQTEPLQIQHPNPQQRELSSLMEPGALLYWMMQDKSESVGMTAEETRIFVQEIIFKHEQELFLRKELLI